MIKSIEKVFQPRGLNVIKFSIRKMNYKNFNSMTNNDRIEAVRFIEDCKISLGRFQDSIKKDIR